MSGHLSVDLTNCVRYGMTAHLVTHPPLAKRQAWYDWFAAERDRLGLTVRTIARQTRIKQNTVQEWVDERLWLRAEERVAVERFMVTQGATHAPPT